MTGNWLTQETKWINMKQNEAITKLRENTDDWKLVNAKSKMNQRKSRWGNHQKVSK